MLLAPPPPADLPAETLLARVRARRAALDLPGAVAAGAASPLVVIAWLYPRLERPLRLGVSPYLEVEAMHCLLLALRHRLGGEPVPAGLLRQPWLAAELPALLDQPGEPRVVVARLEAWLAADYPLAAGLARGYLKQGPGRVEQQLATGILAHALVNARAPEVRMTIGFLIDLRNLLAVLRHWRWQLRSTPELLSGGELDPGLLARAWATGDAATVGRLADRLSGVKHTELEPRAAERQLLGGLTERLRRAGREPLGVGVIIDYLWRCQVAFRNRALQQAADGEDGLLAAALL